MSCPPSGSFKDRGENKIFLCGGMKEITVFYI